MMRIVLGLFMVAALGMAVFSFASGGRGKQRTLNVVGSTSIEPFAGMLSEEYGRTRPGANVEVQGGGSTAGLQACAEGIADIGMCSRSLRDDEARGFSGIPIALDGLAVVVHPSNPVGELSRVQIRDIFSGAITNWSKVGGDDRRIWPITREEGSGTREAFVKLVMEVKHPAGHDAAISAPAAEVNRIPPRISRKALTQESNGAVKELVKGDPCAVGYLSLGLVGTEVKALEIDGAAATAEHVVSGTYGLARPFLFVTKGAPGPAAQQFIDYVLSPEGQQMLQSEGLVRAR